MFLLEAGLILLGWPVFQNQPLLTTRLTPINSGYEGQQGRHQHDQPSYPNEHHLGL